MNNCNKAYHVQPLIMAVWPKVFKHQCPKLNGWMILKCMLMATPRLYQAELLNLMICGPVEEADPHSHFSPETCICLCLSGHKRPACRQCHQWALEWQSVPAPFRDTCWDSDNYPLVLAAYMAGSQDIPKMHLPFSGTRSKSSSIMLFPVALYWGLFLILPSHWCSFLLSFSWQ